MESWHISGSTKLAAVIGSPISHSLSPIIHNAGFRAINFDAVYLAFEYGTGDAEEAVTAMRNLPIIGLSVTMPLKTEICDYVDELSDSAKALNSCNCIYWKGSSLIGESTDGIGFINSYLEKFPNGLDDKRVGIIGAGGAARSIIVALNYSNCEEILIANRSKEKAEAACVLSEKSKLASVNDFDVCDIIINATSIGMSGSSSPDQSPLPPGLLTKNHVVVDIVYNPIETELLKQAKSVGAATLGGVLMLVHQAAAAFQLWTNEIAPIKPMKTAANAMIG